MGEEKTQLNIMFVGQIDSTTVDNFITNLGGVNKNVIEQLEKESEGPLKFILEKTKKNLKKSLLWEFQTTRYIFSVVDILDKADSVVLVIDSTTDLKAGISMDGQNTLNEKCGLLPKLKHIICCCCNKMEATPSGDCYDEITKEVSSHLANFGFNINDVFIVPICSDGENISKRGVILDWYKGPTLLEAFDLFNEPNRFSGKKNLLQGYSLRAYKQFPCYRVETVGEPHNMKFKCTVEIHDQKFQSLGEHPHRKKAEEDAAQVAWATLLGDDDKESVLHLINRDRICLKSILRELALKAKLSEPIYSSYTVEGSQMSRWVSSVLFEGQEYTGDRASNKRLSGQKAARTAIQSILDSGDQLLLTILLRHKMRLAAVLPKKGQELFCFNLEEAEDDSSC